ncbi:MAG: hypothetical protein HUU03_06305 [Planctomycetaceae bacterium]|nr:hypothetical protein [Planctomycetota bacterium]MCQ3949126.1 hypothetical protein [Planctomycetota bacterium]NUO16037.1 hypothetical protein [Planctomycetaceae bacterium]GIK51219.1 MAG: hypothetical protein BroJett014_01920 [Planctomycetota bacterium]HRJ77973.1 hypothetical protein [Planctomycetota bacterium]
MDFVNEIPQHDPNGLAAVAALLGSGESFSDEQLLARREEIRKCQSLLKRVQKLFRDVDFSEHVTGLIRALDKAEARESARMIAVHA